jgi:transposase-like protein
MGGKNHNEEFKRAAVARMAVAPHGGIRLLARELGVTMNTLFNWRKAFGGNGKSPAGKAKSYQPGTLQPIFPSPRSDAELAKLTDEIEARLFRRIRDLLDEREVLIMKKAATEAAGAVVSFLRARINS